MRTVATLIEDVAAAFSAAPLHYGHGTDNAWDEAVYLVTQTLGLADDRSLLAQEVSEQHWRQVQELAAQRINTRKPLAYLLQRVAYVGFEFIIREGVVIPRSPIGPLLAAGGIDPWLAAAPRHVLDLCAGSGCLGILAALLYEDANVTLLENDPRALELCQANIAKHGLDERVQVVAADVMQPWPLTATFDLVLSNPPYVDAPDMLVLPAEYTFEPRQGLASGGLGLDHINAILAQLPSFLAPQGLFVGEVGNSSAALARSRPDLPFIWPDLPDGGEGVFLLEGGSLAHHTAPAN